VRDQNVGARGWELLERLEFHNDFRMTRDLFDVSFY